MVHVSIHDFSVYSLNTDKISSDVELMPKVFLRLRKSIQVRQFLLLTILHVITRVSSSSQVTPQNPFRLYSFRLLKMTRYRGRFWLSSLCRVGPTSWSLVNQKVLVSHCDLYDLFILIFRTVSHPCIWSVPSLFDRGDVHVRIKSETSGVQEEERFSEDVGHYDTFGESDHQHVFVRRLVYTGSPVSMSTTLGRNTALEVR